MWKANFNVKCFFLNYGSQCYWKFMCGSGLVSKHMQFDLNSHLKPWSYHTGTLEYCHLAWSRLLIALSYLPRHAPATQNVNYNFMAIVASILSLHFFSSTACVDPWQHSVWITQCGCGQTRQPPLIKVHKGSCAESDRSIYKLITRPESHSKAFLFWSFTVQSCPLLFTVLQIKN